MSNRKSERLSFHHWADKLPVSGEYGALCRTCIFAPRGLLPFQIRLANLRIMSAPFKT
jgi:hypothetical protein